MTDVVMPQMGESIVEGTLTKWLKKVGDQVQRDEPLFEISTDKVDSEIPAPAAGVLTEVLAAEGSTVAINTVVARIGAAGGVAAAAPAPAVAAAPPPPPPPPPAPVAVAPPPPPPAPAPVAAPAAPVSEEAGMLSPLVRRMARENNVDLALVTGTGAGGRVTKQDVEAYLASRGAAAPAPAAAVAAPAAPVAAAAAAVPPPPAGAVPPKTQVVPMTTMRQKIAEHMIFSKQTSAHVTTVHKVDMTKVAKLRDKIKGAFQERYGFSLTFLSFIARATSEALKAYPLVNASIEGKNIVYHNEVNLGIAVALDGGNGLIVPVIKNADEKNVVGLQRYIVDLANRARGKQLKPDEVQGGTFSITNFGSFGSVFATPVINQPQVAILGVGTVEKTPVVVDDMIAIRSIAYLALTFDHRLIDGAMADQFCQKVKHILENWTDTVL
ncbi:MAG: 2-oxoglutarate dehydrogenase, E2 component, dihydrolipoamide succinyltransferase [Acidobacteria bacterium]|nr:2-oxoglutarate dehydrogenase, E2 component, dihydrolipoamide succinyltransferase [Acidobacteriota bacterium]